MANYTSLWTSASDKEFRQMSKFHSLQRQRLGLKMGGIQREHARHVRRVRVEIREAGTLVRHYEDEKERRARHLLTTFSKVQKKKRATQDWKLAHQHRKSIQPPASATFEVQIGDADAPWGGGRRRDSQLSSRRRSSLSSLSSVFTNKSVTKASLYRRTSSDFNLHRKLPSIKGSQSRNFGNSTSSSGLPGYLKTWQAALGSYRKWTDSSDEEGHPSADDNAGDGEPGLERVVTSREVGTNTDAPKANRRVFWTETFPFVYHSVGETVCPRYKVFLQYDECQVHPGKPRKLRRKQSSTSIAAKSTRSISALSSSRPSLKGLAQSLGAIQSLSSTLSSLSLTQSDL